MKVFTLQSEQCFDQPLDRIFAFFSDARNLEKLTPPWLHFRILSPEPIIMAEGLRIDYRLKIHGLPLRWQSEITAWEPPSRFVDEQRRGPYRLWIHEHSFSEKDGKTWVRDSIRYAVPGGSLVRKLFVEPDLRRVFAYRREQLSRSFPSS